MSFYLLLSERETLALAIGRFGPMLAEVVVFGYVQGNCGIGRFREVRGSSQQGATEGQTRNVLKNVGVFDRLRWGLSPGKGSMAGDQHSGYGDWIESSSLETASDDGSSIADVALGDFVGGKWLGDGNRTMEVIGVGGAEAGDGAPGLRPRGCKLGVGVDDAADLGKLAVEVGMRVQVARGAKRAFDDFAFEVGDNEVAGCHGNIVDAAGLDDDERLGTGAVDATGVAEGVRSKAAAGDFLIGAKDLLAKVGEEHGNVLSCVGPGGVEF